MSSAGVNVLRWSALGLGLVYGLYHQSTISAADKIVAVKHDYERKQKLIEQAKAEWQKRTNPAESSAVSGGVITDPEHPKFDLEKFLNKQ